MMTSEEQINKTMVFVKEKLTNAEGGHDWYHTQRVFKTSQFIAKTEKVDDLVVALGALLHDIADSKFHDGNETVGPEMTREFLFKLNVDSLVIEHVIKIIKNISFKSSLPGNEGQTFSSPELMVVQDADRLDALGAIGIARCFNYGGFKNRPLYNSDFPPRPNMSKSEYKASTGPTINHFYEKLLLLKDKMNTKIGKKLALERHNYMLLFLDRFYKEWNANV